ncbi:transposase [Syntrophothermus lipocalidus]|uniref:Transposase IS3/IS911 family protein n=1 Tax=Syntrophothermus lipocalidus (strain DSM 12680 / TGB-C1) TaxID=643648 RepID=D7CIW4_SYNLT|nr:transposase [Syntrophothermus lipocalidus]ADI02842.1 transposase IS3/IS911 family protein [Syntrophothermus lipocalidus DSM 12680]
MTVKQKAYTANQKVDLILQFLSSGKSLSEFCAQQQIKQDEFRTWKKQFFQAGRDSLRYGISFSTYRKRIQELEEKIERLELDNIILQATIRFLRERG